MHFAFSFSKHWICSLIAVEPFTLYNSLIVTQEREQIEHLVQPWFIERVSLHFHYQRIIRESLSKIQHPSKSGIVWLIIPDERELPIWLICKSRVGIIPLVKSRPCAGNFSATLATRGGQPQVVDTMSKPLWNSETGSDKTNVYENNFSHPRSASATRNFTFVRSFVHVLPPPLPYLLPLVASYPPPCANSRGRQKDAEKIEILFYWLAPACLPAKILRPSNARPSKRSLFHRVSARIFGAAALPALVYVCVCACSFHERKATRRVTTCATTPCTNCARLFASWPTYLEIRSRYSRQFPTQHVSGKSAVRIGNCSLPLSSPFLLPQASFPFFILPLSSLVECRDHVPSPALAKEGDTPRERKTVRERGREGEANGGNFYAGNYFADGVPRYRDRAAQPACKLPEIFPAFSGSRCN